MNMAPLRRHIFEPLFLMKSRSPKLAYWRKLEKTQYYTRQHLEDIQWIRLQELWKFLWQRSEFYRQRFQEAGLVYKDLKSPDDIRRLPVLTKEEIRNQGTTMISSGYQLDKLLHFKTGGSTGKALDIFITEECSELRNAVARRHDRWTGWEPGEPIGAVWGNPKLPRTIREKLIDACVQPYFYMDTMSVTDKSVREFASAWAIKKPALLFGHAHSLFILAQKAKSMGIETIRPTGIISTSMMLIPHERIFIEEVFGCKLIDRYGCEEVSLIACECEQHEGMHMNIEHLVIEFIKNDGSHAASGEQGRIVVTDLMNKAMPFVRYQVEDIGERLDRECSCGRGLPLMGNVAGRMADYLIKRDGTSVSGISLIENTLTKIPGIDQMQIVQESMELLKLIVVPGKGFGEGERKELMTYFLELFGPGVEVKLKTVREIMPEQSGKYRFSICKLR